MSNRPGTANSRDSATRPSADLDDPDTNGEAVANQEEDPELGAVLGRTDSVLRSRRGSTPSKINSLRRKSVNQRESASPSATADSPASPTPSRQPEVIAPAVAQEIPVSSPDATDSANGGLLSPEAASEYPSGNGSIGSRLR